MTIVQYGPDDKTVTKVVAAFHRHPDDPRSILKRWVANGITELPKFRQELVAFIQSHQPQTIVVGSRVIGCIHEEGKDYPDGQACPFCPFWHGRDRWAGLELIKVTTDQLADGKPWPGPKG